MSAVPAIADAIDVLPIPGGPYKIIELSSSVSTMRRIIMPSPTKWRWPMMSSIDRGRKRRAKFAFIFKAPSKLYDITSIAD
ncbi:hypothetical protein LPICM02_30015 [Pseudolactococcus piscium]|nr:hypothetical protein LPICM02_30015 [Lactococcus piscium]